MLKWSENFTNKVFNTSLQVINPIQWVLQFSLEDVSL